MTVTITTTEQDRRIKAFAKTIAKYAHRRILAQIEEFEEDRRQWYTHGDGRPPRWIDTKELGRINVGGKGHTYPTCIHGASQWTDYDNICGWCEDGATPLELALHEGYARAARFVTRCDAVKAARDAGMPIGHEQNDWVNDALDGAWDGPAAVKLDPRRLP